MSGSAFSFRISDTFDTVPDILPIAFLTILSREIIIFCTANPSPVRVETDKRNLACENNFCGVIINKTEAIAVSISRGIWSFVLPESKNAPP